MRGNHSFKSLNGFSVLDDIDVLLLRPSAGHELEGGFVAKVTEGLAGSPADIDCLDVADGEVFGILGTLSLETGLEVAQFAQADTLSLEYEFAQTAYRHGEETHDVALRIHAAVTGYVLGKLVDVDALIDLSHAISLGFDDLSLGSSGTGAEDCNTVVNHSFNVLKVLD